ncbi:MAG: 16S rRNA (adenine(1518)-N(6)/adenine(1519)-N(6))-dimethyltransferase RsmA [Bacteroidetes bacterium]|nr:16S rRNA (adenine(1518)-N(6)/adenine(1519)-N(6))-dimethyltransferase RsmA [Bacteroidota bacterium]
MNSFIRPLKSLGQHFLNSPETAARIAHSLSSDSTYNQVLEIGPGTGVLTEYLMQNTSKKLFCIEVDDRSIPVLINKFPELEDRIINDDFLKASLHDLGNEPFAIIGNFPYNISSQILFRVLEFYERVPELVGMFQKEVAQRIASGPGSKDYGILSVLLQAHYDIEYLFTVPPEVFIPPPKVQSGVIRMKLRENHLLKCDPVLFKKIIKTGFNQRRKTLRNSIKSLLPIERDHIPYLDKRPEQLHFTQFVELTLLLSGKISN